MDLKEVIALKKELEKTISKEVASFCDQTGITVNDVTLNCHEAKDVMGEIIARVYFAHIIAQI